MLLDAQIGDAKGAPSEVRTAEVRNLVEFFKRKQKGCDVHFHREI